MTTTFTMQQIAKVLDSAGDKFRAQLGDSWTAAAGRVSEKEVGNKISIWNGKDTYLLDCTDKSCQFSKLTYEKGWGMPFLWGCMAQDSPEPTLLAAGELDIEEEPETFAPDTTAPKKDAICGRREMCLTDVTVPSQDASPDEVSEEVAQDFGNDSEEDVISIAETFVDVFVADDADETTPDMQQADAVDAAVDSDIEDIAEDLAAETSAPDVTPDTQNDLQTKPDSTASCNVLTNAGCGPSFSCFADLFVEGVFKMCIHPGKIKNGDPCDKVTDCEMTSVCAEDEGEKTCEPRCNSTGGSPKCKQAGADCEPVMIDGQKAPDNLGFCK